jgi:hypothetical protein
MSDKLAHGASKYSNDKCRCDECRTGWAAYVQKRKLQRKAWVQKNGLPKDVPHGSSAYFNWGCRCRFCTDESTRVYRERREARREQAVA